MGVDCVFFLFFFFFSENCSSGIDGVFELTTTEFTSDFNYILHDLPSK